LINSVNINEYIPYLEVHLNLFFFIWLEFLLSFAKLYEKKIFNYNFEKEVIDKNTAIHHETGSTKNKELGHPQN